MTKKIILFIILSLILPVQVFAWSPVLFSGNIGNDITYLLDAPFTNDDIGTNSYDFESGDSDYIDISDHDDLSFTDGADNDEPVSICSWVNMDDATTFPIVGKDPAGGAYGEYEFTVNSSDKLELVLYDFSAGGYIYRRYNTAITSYEGKWIYVCGTYDGTETSGGIDLLLNCVAVDDTGGDSSYSGMENRTDHVNIGRERGNYGDGKIAKVAIWNEKISNADCQDAMANSYSGLASATKTNLVAWWDLDVDTNDDHATSCGGSGCDGTAKNGVAAAGTPDYPTDSWMLIAGQTITGWTEIIPTGSCTVNTSNGSTISGDFLNCVTTFNMTCDVSDADVSYQLKITIPANDASADCYDILVRYSDADNTDRVRICDETAGNDLSYISEDTTVETELDAVDIDWTQNTEYTIDIVVTGNNYHYVDVNSVNKISDTTVEASNIANTEFGGNTINDQTFKIRDVLIW